MGGLAVQQLVELGQFQMEGDAVGLACGVAIQIEEPGLDFGTAPGPAPGVSTPLRRSSPLVRIGVGVQLG